eukprot:scaffold76871_cov31-Prasinocladus_malaysianus.AAC.1
MNRRDAVEPWDGLCASLQSEAGALELCLHFESTFSLVHLAHIFTYVFLRSLICIQTSNPVCCLPIEDTPPTKRDSFKQSAAANLLLKEALMPDARRSEEISHSKPMVAAIHANKRNSIGEANIRNQFLKSYSRNSSIKEKADAE